MLQILLRCASIARRFPSGENFNALTCGLYGKSLIVAPVCVSTTSTSILCGETSPMVALATCNRSSTVNWLEAAGTADASANSKIIQRMHRLYQKGSRRFYGYASRLAIDPDDVLGAGRDDE